MEMYFERNTVSKGWHVYGKKVLQILHRGEKLEAKKKDNEVATEIDPYVIPWTVKKKDKLVPVVVGHIPRGISLFTKFFLNYGERILSEGFFFTIQTIPNPIRRAWNMSCCYVFDIRRKIRDTKAHIEFDQS